MPKVIQVCKNYLHITLQNDMISELVVCIFITSTKKENRTEAVECLVVLVRAAVISFLSPSLGLKSRHDI